MAITLLENFVDDFEVKTSTKNQPSVRFVRIFCPCPKTDFEKNAYSLIFLPYNLFQTPYVHNTYNMATTPSENFVDDFELKNLIQN